MRINKYLASCELGSRRKVEEYILKGLVSVNDEIVTDLGRIVAPNDIVKYKGQTISPEMHKVYIMLNKPKCYITSMSDDQNRKVVVDLVKTVKEKVFPVGRLDYNTEGLLLLTNDGDFANSITHPSKHISKTYEVKTKYELTQKELKNIRNGIVIDGVRTLPAKAQNMGLEGEYYVSHITIYEGRNREVRKMFESLNLKVYNLKRIAIGELSLGTLAMGKYKYLDKSDLNKIFVEF